MDWLDDIIKLLVVVIISLWLFTIAHIEYTDHANLVVEGSDHSYFN